MYRLIMLDLDGTLVNSFRGISETYKDAFEHFGIEKIPESEMTALIGPTVYDILRIRFNKSHDDATVMAEWIKNDYKENHLFDSEPYPGIVELLKRLKSDGFQTAIVTNNECEHARLIAEHFGLAPYFDGIYGCDSENDVQKYQLIEKCLRETHVKNKDAVMVGDTEYDKEAADRCNVDFVPVSYGFGKWNIRSCANADELFRMLSG